MKRNNKGISLIEIVVTVAVIAIVVVPLISGFFTAMGINSDSRRMQNATNIAQDVMEVVKAKDIEHVLDEMVTDWRFFDTKDRNVVRAKTFGNFDVFVGDTLVTFEREKSKELLAYLIDRRGSSVTTEQIAVVLWEDEPYDRKMKNRVTMIISSLRNSLRNMEIEDILVKSWNHLAIDTSRIKCDSWEYEKGDTAAINSFHGEYMVNYSWAEETTGKYTQMENKL